MGTPSCGYPAGREPHIKSFPPGFVLFLFRFRLLCDQFHFLSPSQEDLPNMPLSTPFDGLLANAFALGIPLVLARLLVSYLTSPLKQFPGPLFAKFTDLWMLLDYLKCMQIRSHQELHEKLGPAVRIGPNMISLSDPALFKTVYSTRGDFVKVRSVAELTYAVQQSNPTETRSTADTSICRVTFTRLATRLPTGTGSRTSSAHEAMLSTGGTLRRTRNTSTCPPY